jgi:hypothetical protein
VSQSNPGGRVLRVLRGRCDALWIRFRLAAADNGLARRLSRQRRDSHSDMPGRAARRTGRHSCRRPHGRGAVDWECGGRRLDCTERHARLQDAGAGWLPPPAPPARSPVWHRSAIRNMACRSGLPARRRRRCSCRTSAAWRRMPSRTRARSRRQPGSCTRCSAKGRRANENSKGLLLIFASRDAAIVEDAEVLFRVGQIAAPPAS